jgi:hypothetical protein
VEEGNAEEVDVDGRTVEGALVVFWALGRIHTLHKQQQQSH